jgi:hypothetical protein
MEKYFNSAKIFYYQMIRKPVLKSESNEIVRQIRETSEKLNNAYSRFEYENNEDLLESVIFEIQSLKALYRYLLKKARETGIECAEISVFGREVG